MQLALQGLGFQISGFDLGGGWWRRLRAYIGRWCRSLLNSFCRCVLVLRLAWLRVLFRHDGGSAEGVEAEGYHLLFVLLFFLFC